MSKLIIIATSNMQKLKDFIRVNEEGNYHYNILSMRDYGIDIDINEDGETYQENAYIKAKAVHNMISKDVDVIADDCG
jgi:XTP/dITP diphosphohydrolase